MDPLSILSLVEACAGLAVTAGKLAIGLKSLADNYKQAALTFRSLSSQCKLFATAVRAIQAWMEEAPEVTTIDDSIWEQLTDSLECAKDAIYALENELVSTSGTSVNTFWNKANVVWNIQSMRDLEDCIHKQICSLSVILQIMNLPTRKSQTDGLRKQSSVFQESRFSAMSVRDAETSTLKGGGDATSTIRAPSTIMTSLSQLPQFDFDEMLLTSQVYLRNRNRTLALYDWKAGIGKTRDSETSVSEWDLAPKRNPNTKSVSDHSFDLREIIRILGEGDAEEARIYLESTLVGKHQILEAKYDKVKRYYFERAAQVAELENENNALKSGDPEKWSDASMEIEKRTIVELRRELEILHKMTKLAKDQLRTEQKKNVDHTQEIERLKKQMNWYRIRLSYWEEHSPNHANVSIGYTAYSPAAQQNPPVMQTIRNHRYWQQEEGLTAAAGST